MKSPTTDHRLQSIFEMQPKFNGQTGQTRTKGGHVPIVRRDMVAGHRTDTDTPLKGVRCPVPSHRLKVKKIDYNRTS